MGAVGDILYNFVDRDGNLVDHPVNQRAVAIDLDSLSRIPKCVLVSGGPDKIDILSATLKRVAPTTLITDEQSAYALLDL